VEIQPANGSLSSNRRLLKNMPDLGLQYQAEKHFGFLVSDKGYKCIESTPYRVRFQSPTAFVELVFDGNRSYELGLLVGEIGSENCGNAAFSIDEILRYCRTSESKRFSLVQVTSRETLASFVEQLSQLLRIYGADFLTGKKNCFAELAEQRRKESENYTFERDLRMARTKAEAAWHRKDYATVVKALEPFRAALTASEVGRLDFAEKKSGW
jgi:hypothetical protein